MQRKNSKERKKNTNLILWSLQVGLWSLCVVVKWALFFIFSYLMELHVREQRDFGPFSVVLVKVLKSACGLLQALIVRLQIKKSNLFYYSVYFCYYL